MMLEINSTRSQEIKTLASCVTLAFLASGFLDGVEFK